ncbi:MULTISPECIES: DUF3800 domain-containing protein [unclassified Streptomyces]|uniref:DUF3800 domain-containing protein n=1 Tax=unclassified Streptomyces TaxID=2593676 RepID=UPI0038101235
MTTGPVLEIACDESGSDGENLIGGNTDVFAHAGVRMDPADADACLREMRDRIRSPAQEYKANHLLREKHRPVLEWFLGPSGPLPPDARVHLTDKAFLVVRRVAEVLLDDRAEAAPLYREGRAALPAAQWRRFLESANDLVRTRNRDAGPAPVDAFFRTLDALPGTPLAARLRHTRPRAEAFRARVADGPPPLPELDPLLPSLARTIGHFGRDGHPVSVVHDRQNTLTEERVHRLEAILPPPSRLASLTLVESRSDPRVQLADFLAGVARKIASDALGGRADTPLTALLRPHVDPHSLWADEPSRKLLLSPATESGGPRNP